MYHLRQVFTTIGVVTTMYVAGRFSSDGVFSLMRPDMDGASLMSRIVVFLLSVLAGILLMKLLTWRLRLVAMLVLPTLIPLVIATYVWLEIPAYGMEFSYLEALELNRLLFIYPAGMLIGGLAAHFSLRNRES